MTSPEPEQHGMATVTLSVRDIPAFKAVIQHAVEVVMAANALGSVDRDAPSLRRLTAALDCLSPEDDEDPLCDAR